MNQVNLSGVNLCQDISESHSLYVHNYIFFVLLFSKGFFFSRGQIRIISRSIWPIDETVTGTTNTGQNIDRGVIPWTLVCLLFFCCFFNVLWGRGLILLQEIELVYSKPWPESDDKNESLHRITQMQIDLLINKELTTYWKTGSHDTSSNFVGSNSFQFIYLFWLNGQ